MIVIEIPGTHINLNNKKINIDKKENKDEKSDISFKDILDIEMKRLE